MLVGATAIEDKLQDGVPEAIATLLSVHASLLELSFRHGTTGADSDLPSVHLTIQGRSQNVGVDRRQDGNCHQHRLLVLSSEQQHEQDGVQVLSHSWCPRVRRKSQQGSPSFSCALVL